MTIEVKKTKITTKTAELTLSPHDVQIAIIAAVKRDHKELKDYVFKVEWDNDGGAVVTGTSSNGGEG